MSRLSKALRKSRITVLTLFPISLLIGILVGMLIGSASMGNTHLGDLLTDPLPLYVSYFALACLAVVTIIVFVMIWFMAIEGCPLPRDSKWEILLEFIFVPIVGVLVGVIAGMIISAISFGIALVLLIARGLTMAALKHPIVVIALVGVFYFLTRNRKPNGQHGKILEE